MRKRSSFTFRSLIICIVLLLANCVFAAAQHEKIIYTFGVQPGDGVGPNGGLISDAAGNLYGVTFGGGANNLGTVYELIPPISNGPWTESVLYSFGGSPDGTRPLGNLVFDAVGNLYGIAEGGGNTSCTDGCGAVFELSPPSLPGGSWTENVLCAFQSGSDGAIPTSGIVFDKAGNLYGTTVFGGDDNPSCMGPPTLFGCGTVFELFPPLAPGGPWTEAVLYSFTDGLDGGGPEAPVIIDGAGNLYGTTAGGGDIVCGLGPCGTVFELSPSGNGSWIETVIHNFGSLSDDGEYPSVAGLLLTNSGALVGTTPEGGKYGYGTVFGMQPPQKSGGNWNYAVLYNFGKSLTDGLGPVASVVFSGGKLYGTTQGGGANTLGTVFQLASPSRLDVWKETALYSFKGGSDGKQPELAPLLFHNGAVYGTTGPGGSADGGVVFRIGQ